MAFFEERFPDEIAQGATGGPRFRTTIGETGAGFESTNREWSQPRHYYEVSQAIKQLTRFELVRAFFYVVSGSADGFRFKDYTNFRVAQAVGVMVLVSGSVYQLFKAERYAAREYLRKIQKPVAGTVTVWRTRAGVTSTISPSVDYTTGKVTVTGHVGGDTYAWAGEFDVPVRFVEDTMEMAQAIGPDGHLFVDWPAIRLREVKIR